MFRQLLSLPRNLRSQFPRRAENERPNIAVYEVPTNVLFHARVSDLASVSKGLLDVCVNVLHASFDCWYQKCDGFACSCACLHEEVPFVVFRGVRVWFCEQRKHGQNFGLNG